MSLQSKEEIPTRNRKNGLLEIIMAKYKECNETSYLQIAINHLKTFELYLKSVEQKGPAPFRNRTEYQKFEVAKLFIDRINLLEFSLDPSFSGYNEYKDKGTPPLDAFGMTPDLKESKKIKFCRNLEQGDILHLRVVEESDTEYKFLVINKYDENERVIDYLIDAFIIKTYQLNKLPRPLKINDYFRAAVFGKLKQEEKSFSKLLVTLNNTKVKKKDVKLGLILKSDIKFYPEDISSHMSYLSYMKAEKDLDNPQEMIKHMTSLGLNPYKTYSFDKSRDGKKLGQAKKFNSSTEELLRMEESMNKIRESKAMIVKGRDSRAVLPLIEEALEIYPQNDVAYALRGQLCNKIFIVEKNPEFLRKALKNCEKALELNSYNLTATRLYLTYLLLSAKSYKDEGNIEKATLIEKVLARYKYIPDVSELLNEGDEENKMEQSSPGGAESSVVPMDLSDG